VKVKLFWKKNPVRFSPLLPIFGVNDIVTPFEDEINAWLQEHPHIKIADIRQSATGGSWGPMLWSISVWYEEGDS
jgi:hypothetical protein